MKLRFFLVSFLLIVSRGYDYASTLIYTPDLAKEGNPIITGLGLNAWSLLAVQVTIVALIIGCFYLYVFKKYTPPASTAQLSFTEFIPFFHFRKRESFAALFYKMPDVKSLLYYVGYTVTWSLILIGFIVGTSTTLLILVDGYKGFYRAAGFTILCTLLVVMPLLFTYRFYKMEYEQYVERLKPGQMP